MKRFYAWTRDLHLYLGLFLCPFLLVFAGSTLLLNHNWHPSDAASGSTPPKKSVPIAVPDGVGTLEQARNILRQLHVTGEIDYVSHRAKEERLLIPVSKPGEHPGRSGSARPDRHGGRQEQGLGTALIYLHRCPARTT